MTNPAPHERPTLEDVIDGKHGARCPKCGSTLIPYKTIKQRTKIIRYMGCHNADCESRFYTKQEYPEIVREIPTDEVSNVGIQQLTVHRESA